MSTEIDNEMRTTLTAERDALREFVSLLEHEQSALVENLSEQVLVLAEQKSELALRLNSLVEARNILFRHHYAGMDASSIQREMQLHDPRSWNLWLELRDYTAQAQRLNQSSGELIQLKLRHNQQALAVLNNAANQANLYGANGQPSFTPGTGRQLASA